MEFTAPGLQPLVDHQGDGVGHDGAGGQPHKPWVIVHVLNCCSKEDVEIAFATVLLATCCFYYHLCQQHPKRNYCSKEEEDILNF